MVPKALLLAQKTAQSVSSALRASTSSERDPVLPLKHGTVQLGNRLA